ncbi:hypothetical protein [Leifsonia sp. fls2-241-R2A-40a]|uniref:hypothetical protein n=1 Tax=Leifsonia sp. fls2-241-R2A-40a TaxID=3040290 RepID=UPI00254CD971|nr:hypothetical protein [Leifsonia sp. fls2-241-R2A-40a]
MEATEADVRAGRAAQVGDPIARKLVLSPRAEVPTRVLTAMIGVQILTQPQTTFDTALASTSFLATRMNLGERATWRLVKQAAEFGFLRPAGKSIHRVNRYRLGSRGDARELEIGDTYADTITALAIGDTSDPLAELILSVTDPTWAYAAGWDGIRGWWASVLALAAAPADPALGLSAKTRTQLRKKVAAEFTRAGQPGIGQAPLLPQLEALSETTLAKYVYADAVEAANQARAVQAAKNAEFAKNNAARKAMDEKLDETFFTSLRTKFGALPAKSWDKERTNAWWKAFQPWWRAEVQPQLTNPVVTARIKHQLAWRLNKREHPLAEWIIDTLPWETVPAAPLIAPAAV